MFIVLCIPAGMCYTFLYLMLRKGRLMHNIYSEVDHYIVNLFNAYTDMQKTKREYVPGVNLYPSEIHAIERIVDMEDLNLTELADYLGITRGAATKMTNKLQKMGLIERYKQPSNKKEIYLKPTEQGIEAYHGHQQYHAKMDTNLTNYLESLPNTKQATILTFLKLYLDEMKNL